MMAGVGDEMVLLDSINGHYFSLDRIGRRMLDLALGEVDQAQIISRLQSQYDAEPAQLKADFIDLMSSLEKAGLIESADRIRTGKQTP